VSTFSSQNQPDSRFTADHARVHVLARRDSILRLHERGLVPLAIASKLNLSVSYVSHVLREAGIEIPSYLETHGPRPGKTLCPHCGRPLR
jgi:hypothetical protein